jgi:hypothetical protein
MRFAQIINLGIFFWVSLCYAVITVRSNSSVMNAGVTEKCITSNLSNTLKATGQPGSLLGMISDQVKAAKLYGGRLTSGLDAKSFSIFERIRLDSGAELTPVEQEWLKEKGLDKALAQYRGSGSLVRGLNHLVALSRRDKPLEWKSLNWKQKARKWMRSYFSFGLPTGPKARAERIFSKFIESPDLQLTPSEQNFLSEWHLESELARFRKELAQNRKGFLVVSRIEKVGSMAKWGILGSSAAVAAILGQILQKDLGLDESFDSDHPDGIHKRGTLELIIPVNSNNPKLMPILIVGGGVFKFDYGNVSFDLMSDPDDPSARSEILKQLRESHAEFYRIRLKATPQQISELTDLSHLGKYVDMGSGNPVYVDTPSGEIYRILSRELGLPPLPLVNRSSEALLDYFKLLKTIEVKNGPVEEIYRVAHPEQDPLSISRAISTDALSGFLDASILLSMPVTDIAGLAYDQKKSTVIKPKSLGR